MYLGYESGTGNVYEGAGLPEYAVVPPPVLSQARLIERETDLADLPRGVLSSPFEWVFREDFFDPVSRVRRGRLFQAYPDGQPRHWLTKGHPTDDGGEALRGVGRTKPLYTYWPCTKLLELPRGGLGAKLALGQSGTVSLWKIVQAERIIGDDVLVTLKALVAFGLLPELNEEVIPDEHRTSIVRAVSRVLDSAFRESPTSVIDQCRSAATVLLERWMVMQGAPATTLGQELGKLVGRVLQDPYNLQAVSRAGEIVRLLHTRGKANVQEAKGYRPPQEEDGEAAVSLVGFMIRELGWAK